MPLFTNPKIQIFMWAQVSTFLLKQARQLELLPLSPGGDPTLGSLHGAEHRAEAGGVALTALPCWRALLPLPSTTVSLPHDGYLWHQQAQNLAQFHVETEQFWPEMPSEEMPP